MTEEVMRERVAAARVGRLATVGTGGLPHLVPFCFAAEGDVLYSAVDSKPKRTRRLQRLRTAARERNVSAPAGEQFEIRWGDQRAVAVELGGGLRWYEQAGRPLLAGYAEDEPARSSMGLPLVPWPNRIRDGRYTFAGRELQLPINESAR